MSGLAHGLHSGLGITAVKVQIRWWSGVSASGQYPVLQLTQLHRCQRADAIEEAAELEESPIWVWERKSEGGTRPPPLAASISGPTPAYRHCKKSGIATLTGTALLPGRSAGRSAG